MTRATWSLIGVVVVFVAAPGEAAPLVGSAAGKVARCSSQSTRSSHACAADLRLSLVGSPDATRVDGTVTYDLTVWNDGVRAAHHVDIAIDTEGVLAGLSVVSRELSCSYARVPAVRCTTRLLRVGSAMSVAISGRVAQLGMIRLAAWATTSTTEATPANNRASVKTPVLTPDSVVANGTRLSGNRADLPQRFVIDALGAAHGGDSEGTFAFDSRLPDGSLEQLSGRVVCLHVFGNKATVVVRIEHSNAPVSPGATAVGNLTFLLVDNGSPGAGRDTMTYGGGVGAPLYGCGEFPPSVTGFPITDGDVTIVDTP